MIYVGWQLRPGSGGEVCKTLLVFREHGNGNLYQKMPCFFKRDWRRDLSTPDSRGLGTTEYPHLGSIFRLAYLAQSNQGVS